MMLEHSPLSHNSCIQVNCGHSGRSPSSDPHRPELRNGEQSHRLTLWQTNNIGLGFGLGIRIGSIPSHSATTGKTAYWQCGIQ
ncbi:GM21555 [Drosophila sechellia]|uniref:GM21555 n=1 Tax=Drosophila sechellia TaxID=7238 RepID=B4HRE6_DROSE|nr:GM21555 [Drosophila sechellia]